MLLIRNKHTKKLFLALATGGAKTDQSNFATGNLKVFGFGNISLHQANYRVLEFNNPTAAKTQQVVMLSGWFYLIMVVRLIKVKFLY